jgi:lipoprotein NlpD
LGWRWPVDGKIIRRFSANGSGKQGIELDGRVGESIFAASGGRVVYAGNGLRGYGNLVIVKHDAHYLTAYGYNSALLVKEGERVKAGQKIATMGIGPGSAAALHFELRRDGKPVDPLDYLPKR